MRFTYLAAPYTKGTDEERNWRKEQATAATAQLIQQVGGAFFSPLTHGTALAQYLPPRLLGSHNFWMEQCRPFVRVARNVYVLTLPGWEESIGVQMELEWAWQSGIPVYRVGQEFSVCNGVYQLEVKPGVPFLIDPYPQPLKALSDAQF